MQGFVGPYALLSPLSEGGVAQLFLACREGADTLCVLKQLKLSMLSHELAGKRLVREAQITSQLDHPHIAKVRDAGFENEIFYLAMELIRGQELFALIEAAFLNRARLSADLVVGIVMLVLKALTYAHELKDSESQPLNIVHRDLSPRNIMVTYEGEIKIIDFGVAKAETKDALTNPGVLIGTPRYMSPEQAQGHSVDHRTDLYTVSVVLYEMLTGRPLINADKLVDVLIAIRRNEPPPIEEIMPELPKGLGAVLHRGLQKNPQDRWPSAAAYHQALADVYGDIPRLAPRLKKVMQSLFADAQKAQEALLKEYYAVMSKLSKGAQAYKPTLSQNELPAAYQSSRNHRTSSAPGQKMPPGLVELASVESEAPWPTPETFSELLVIPVELMTAEAQQEASASQYTMPSLAEDDPSSYARTKTTSPQERSPSLSDSTDPMFPLSGDRLSPATPPSSKSPSSSFTAQKPSASRSHFSPPKRTMPTWAVATISSVATALVMIVLFIFLIRPPPTTPAVISVPPTVRPAPSVSPQSPQPPVKQARLVPPIRAKGNVTSVKAPSPARSPLLDRIKALDSPPDPVEFSKIHAQLEQRLDQVPNGPIKIRAKRTLTMANINLTKDSLLKAYRAVERARRGS